MMQASAISIHQFSKTYRVPQRREGLRAALSGLIHPSYEDVHAVRNLSFEIQPGEIVGLIGPNGAGKTTTLKMLCGLLHPTSGQAKVIGFVPWQRRPEFLRKISMVLGNKSQMVWDIPPLDTFRVLAEIYHLSRSDFQCSLDELVAMLDLQELLNRPVRNLSLGERMKCELVAGLLHRPAVLFLDEPTLGLDIHIQMRLRQFLQDYNQKHQATVILTSHYMGDVTALCPRVILIHQGRLLYDGELNNLAQRLAPFKLLRVTLPDGENHALANLRLPPGAEILEQGTHHLALRVGREQTPIITASLLNALPVVDLAIEDPPIEAVIDRVFQEGL